MNMRTTNVMRRSWIFTPGVIFGIQQYKCGNEWSWQHFDFVRRGCTPSESLVPTPSRQLLHRVYLCTQILSYSEYMFLIFHHKLFAIVEHKECVGSFSKNKTSNASLLYYNIFTLVVHCMMVRTTRDVARHGLGLSLPPPKLKCSPQTKWSPFALLGLGLCFLLSQYYIWGVERASCRRIFCFCFEKIWLLKLQPKLAAPPKPTILATSLRTTELAQSCVKFATDRPLVSLVHMRTHWGTSVLCVILK